LIGPNFDRRYYPICSKCADLGVPVNIHTSTSLLADVRMDCDHPSDVDHVAANPDLNIVAYHGGWPWVLEMVGIALRHPNVYISPAGVRSRHFAKPDSGWQPLVQYGDTILRDRVPWGSKWPMLPIKRSMREIEELPLRPESRAAWMGDNAARLFGLGGNA